MKARLHNVIAAGSLALTLSPLALASNNPHIDALQKQIDELKAQVEATAEASQANSQGSGFGKSSFGGYGELHFGNYDHKAPDADSSAKDKSRAFDFHRFVLFFGHQFDEKLRFFSEVELEHSLAGNGSDKPGEVELEQAFVEYTVNDAFAWKAGLFLLPVGIMNETHEPPSFYGTERNRVEGAIIPTTWWEAGGGATVRLSDGLTADLNLTSGLETGESFDIRKGRQKVAKATGDALAYTGRLKYTAIPGLELATTLQYQSDLLQGLGTTTDAGEQASATLIEAHAILQSGPFDLRALYAAWNIKGPRAKALGKDEQDGFYIEPGFRLNEMLGLFARYSAWDNGGTAAETKKTSNQFGTNVWVHPNVVFKADFEKINGAEHDKGFNLGVGYHF